MINCCLEQVRKQNCLNQKKKKTEKKLPELNAVPFIYVKDRNFRLYSETKLTLILDSDSSKYPSSVAGVGLT